MTSIGFEGNGTAVQERIGENHLAGEVEHDIRLVQVLIDAAFQIVRYQLYVFQDAVNANNRIFQHALGALDGLPAHGAARDHGHIAQRSHKDSRRKKHNPQA